MELYRDCILWIGLILLGFFIFGVLVLPMKIGLILTGLWLLYRLSFMLLFSEEW